MVDHEQLLGHVQLIEEDLTETPIEEIEPTQVDLANGELAEIIKDANNNSIIGFYDLPKDTHNISNISTPIKQYYREISKIPLLTTEEEVNLFKQMEAEVNASIIRNEEGEEVYWMSKQVTSVWETLVKSNLRLVVSVAKRYIDKGLSLLDLIQEGNIGLMRGIEKFDYTKGFKLSTYVTWWIRLAVTRAITDSSRTIRIPIHVNERLIRMYRIQYNLTEEDHTDQQIAEEMGTTEEEVRKLRIYPQQPLSLEQAVDDEEDTTLRDTVPDTNSLSTEDQGIYPCIQDEVKKLLSNLTPQEERVLRLRFGIGDGRIRTLQEVGAEMEITRKRGRQIDLDGKLRTLAEVGVELGKTRERIRQIEADALAKLRKSEAIKPLKEYLLS